MNNMRNELVDQIRNRLRIEDVIGRTVSLRKSHRGYNGLCPFHDDKMPSFHVYTDTQTYYCFACHESGDIFTFVMKSQSLSFPEALSFLAEMAGIDPSLAGVPSAYSSKSSTVNTKNVHETLSLAQEYFTACLKKLPAGKSYLERRGITLETALSFGLGYAPDSWDDLMKFLAGKGVDPRMMLEAGLVVDGERGMYDRFRGRVTFPVRDVAGRVIAFGARAIVPDVGAKYINSPESSVYRKRSNLYMLNVAGSYIREKGYSILCEGYMDTIRLHIAGFREAVASLGTSLTAEQAGLLHRFADRCYICYDGDNAGQKASLRGMYILAESGLDVRVVRLPDGQDPDDFLRQNPPASFKKALDEALALIPYHIETLRPKLYDPLRRKSALHSLWDGVNRVGADEALRYLASLCSVMMLPPEEVKRRILGGHEAPSPAKTVPVPERATVDNGLECAFCAMLMRSRALRLSTRLEDARGLLTDSEALQTAEAVLTEDAEGLPDMWRTIGETAKIGVITRGEIFLSEMVGLTDAEKWGKILAGLEALRLKRRMSQIRAKMSANAATTDEASEFSELQRKLQGLAI